MNLTSTAAATPAPKLACNKEADSGGNQGPRRCIKSPGHYGNHRYKEIAPDRRWIVGGQDTVSERR